MKQTSFELIGGNLSSFKIPARNEMQQAVSGQLTAGNALSIRNSDGSWAEIAAITTTRFMQTLAELKPVFAGLQINPEETALDNSFGSGHLQAYTDANASKLSAVDSLIPQPEAVSFSRSRNSSLRGGLPKIVRSNDCTVLLFVRANSTQWVSNSVIAKLSSLEIRAFFSQNNQSVTYQACSGSSVRVARTVADRTSVTFLACTARASTGSTVLTVDALSGSGALTAGGSSGTFDIGSPNRQGGMESFLGTYCMPCVFDRPLTLQEIGSVREAALGL